MDELQLIKQTVIKLAEIECKKQQLCGLECPLCLEEDVCLLAQLRCLSIQLEKSIDEGGD